ncbi:MAG: protein kinase [Chthoniobacterales bacterium]
MNTDTEGKKCPQCGSILPSGAPEGLCPSCLLRRGLDSEPAIEAQMPSTPEELAGHFPELEILELLGRGGMGMVYKARQRDLNRFVALKILPHQQDPAFVERFTREAQALARLSHPNIVSVYDFGERDGLFYFLMEYVDGQNLRQRMNAKKITLEETLTLISQICDALEYAHGKGIVHRDIKPENILLAENDQVKIADFGLAKIASENPVNLNLTQAGEVMGTIYYMAPEQIEHPGEVDHRADIYSLGVVFYQMLTGELPLGRFSNPSHKVQVDARLDGVVLRALEKDPALRFSNAGEMKAQIEMISCSRPLMKTPHQETKQRDIKVATSSGGLALKIIIFILLIIAGAFIGTIIASIVTYNLPRLYESKVTLEISEHLTEMQVFKAGQDHIDPRFTSIQFQIIQKKETLYPVIDSLNLVQKWGSEYKIRNNEEAFFKLKGMLSVREVRGTSLIEISVLDSDPQEAADIANAIALEYQKNRSSEQAGFKNKSMANLWEQIETQRHKVVELRAKAARIRSESEIVDSNPDGVNPPAQTISADLNVNAAKYADAKNECIMASRILEAAETRANTEKMQNDMPMSAVKIWEKAEPALAPSRPRVFLYLAGGALIGAFVGFFAALLNITIALLLMNAKYSDSENPSIKTQTDELAIIALVLSVLTYVLSLIAPIGFIFCIPAIICAHLSRGRIKKNSTLKGWGMATAAAFMGYLYLLLLLLLVFMSFVIWRNVKIKPRSAALQMRAPIYQILC